MPRLEGRKERTMNGDAIRWVVHNMIGHPVAGVLWLLADLGEAIERKATELAVYVHNATLPRDGGL